MDNKATTKRMIGAVVLVLVAALLLAFLLKGKNREGQDMAMNQGAETKPILGFPSITGTDQKPMLVGEDPNAAQTAALTAGQTAGQAVDAAGNLIPNVATVPNTTGFEIRPAASGETRQVLDTDGKMKDGAGNLGTGDPKAAAAATASSAMAGTGLLGGSTDQADAGKGSASNKDRPADAVVEVEKKPASRPVLVNERAVPSAAAESKAKAEAAKKLAAEKAAKAKSEELAKSTGAHATVTAPVAAAGGSYGIQLAASADKAKAEAVAATFKAEGYKASVVAAKVDGKAVYRAVIGGYADKAAAAAAQAKMKARFTQNPNVQNSFVTKQ